MYTLEFSVHAIKTLRRVQASDRERIMNAINLLRIDPYACANVKKLKGRQGYRLRVGDWRVIYEIYDEMLIIRVLEIGQRKEIYR